MATKETGRVNENLEPTIAVEFADGTTIKCVVDTGFNGSLFLPLDFIESNGFDLIGEESFHSVSQAEAHLAKVYSATVKWLGEETEVAIIAGEHGSALIGAGMMLNAKLEIDYAASTVVIEKL
jgi:clan AA aspartic protease